MSTRGIEDEVKGYSLKVKDALKRVPIGMLQQPGVLLHAR